jgi:hypothetical protein
VLHPGMTDAALQASIGLMQGTDEKKPRLPFALDELEVFGECTRTMWVYVRYSEGCHAGDNITWSGS